MIDNRLYVENDPQSRVKRDILVALGSFRRMALVPYDDGEVLIGMLSSVYTGGISGTLQTSRSLQVRVYSSFASLNKGQAALDNAREYRLPQGCVLERVSDAVCAVFSPDAEPILRITREEGVYRCKRGDIYSSVSRGTVRPGIRHSTRGMGWTGKKS